MWKYVIGAVATALLFAAIAKAEPPPAEARKVGTIEVRSDGIRFTYEKGYLDSKAKFRRVGSKQKCVVNWPYHTMTCNNKSYPFAPQEARGMSNLLGQTIFKYVIESVEWFEGGGVYKPQLPPNAERVAR